MSQVLQFLKFKVMKSVVLEQLLSLQDTASTARFNPFDQCTSGDAEEPLHDSNRSTQPRQQRPQQQPQQLGALRSERIKRETPFYHIINALSAFQPDKEGTQNIRCSFALVSPDLVRFGMGHQGSLMSANWS